MSFAVSYRTSFTTYETILLQLKSTSLLSVFRRDGKQLHSSLNLSQFFSFGYFKTKTAAIYGEIFMWLAQNGIVFFFRLLILWPGIFFWYYIFFSVHNAPKDIWCYSLGLQLIMLKVERPFNISWIFQIY